MKNTWTEGSGEEMNVSKAGKGSCPLETLSLVPLEASAKRPMLLVQHVKDTSHTQRYRLYDEEKIWRVYLHSALMCKDILFRDKMVKKATASQRQVPGIRSLQRPLSLELCVSSYCDY